jgi:ankyrin repeat protein
MAISSNRIEIVKLLLDYPGVDVNIGTTREDSDYTPYGATPLGMAVYQGATEIVELLLDDPRVNVNIGTAIDYEYSYYAQLSSYYTPLSIAISMGDTEIVELLLDDPRVDVNKTNSLMETPLHHAILHGNASDERSQLVKRLLDDPRVDVNKKTDNGYTPLNLAALIGHIEFVKLLLDDPRVNVNKENKERKTPLYNAASNGYTEIVKILLEDPGTVVDQRTKNDLRDGKFKSEIAELLFAPRAPRAPLPLPSRNIPKNATNAIMLNDIAEGDEMVNFHGESGHGRYYKKSSYNALPSKVNPYTRTPIAPTNVARYKAHLVDPARPAPTNFVEEAKPDTTNFVEEAKRIFREKLGQRAGSRKTRRGNRSGRKTRRVRSRR